MWCGSAGVAGNSSRAGCQLDSERVRPVGIVGVVRCAPLRGSQLDNRSGNRVLDGGEFSYLPIQRQRQERGEVTH